MSGMSERSKRELRQLQEEEEAERLAPLRKAEEEWKSASTELAKLRKDVLLKDRAADYQPGVDPFDASFFNEEMQRGIAVDEFNAFRQSYPEYYTSRYNFEQARAVLEANKCTLPVRTDWSWSFRKLDEAGLLEPWPAPIRIGQKPAEPEPNGYVLSEGKPTRQSRYYTPAEQDAMTSDDFRKTVGQYEQDHPPKAPVNREPEIIVGTDPETGLEKLLTKIQVDRLSADAYRTFMGIKPSELDFKIISRQSRRF